MVRGGRDDDADRKDHAALVVIGRAEANRWVSLPALGPPKEIVRAALRLAGPAAVVAEGAALE